MDNKLADEKVLANRQYRFWLVGDTANELGKATRSFSFPLIALILTNDPPFAGLIGFISVLCTALADFLAGYLTDRHGSLSILRLASWSGLIFSSLLILSLFLGLGQEKWLLLLATILFALRYGATGTSSSVLLTKVVPPQQLGSAISLNQGRDSAIAIAGAPLAGLLTSLYTWAIAPLFLLLDAIGTAIYSRFHRQGIDKKCSLEVTSSEGEAADQKALGVLQGFIWIFRRKDARSIVAQALILNLSSGLVISSQVYGLQQQGVDSAFLGLITGSIGLGMLAGSLLSPTIINRFRSGTVIIVALLGIALGCFCLALPLPTPAILALLLLAFIPVPLGNSILTSYVLIACPDNQLGKVVSATTLFMLLGNSLAPLLVGFYITSLGRGHLTLVAAGLALLCLLLALLTPSIRSMPEQEKWQEHIQAQP